MTRKYGHIEGFPVGSTFSSRIDLSASGVHRPRVAGICGGEDGAESVVLSGGYEDDIDYGSEVIYTGHGGNAEQGGGVQVRDQAWSRGNLGLVRSHLEGMPVRLVRGAHKKSPFAPKSGLRYDGLYYVHSYWEAPGLSGFKVCRFILVRDDASLPPWSEGRPGSLRTVAHNIHPGTVQRVVRNTLTASRVKELHGHKCQMCGTQLLTSGGLYAEGCPIRSLEHPHDGPDAEDNMLCLCPNHHVLFRTGAISIAPNFSLLGAHGRLITTDTHRVNPAHLAYHRMYIARLEA